MKSVRNIASRNESCLPIEMKSSIDKVLLPKETKSNVDGVLLPRETKNNAEKCFFRERLQVIFSED